MEIATFVVEAAVLGAVAALWLQSRAKSPVPQEVLIPVPVRTHRS